MSAARTGSATPTPTKIASLLLAVFSLCVCRDGLVRSDKTPKRADGGENDAGVCAGLQIVAQTRRLLLDMRYQSVVVSIIFIVDSH